MSLIITWHSIAKVGEQRVIYLYSILAIGFEMIIWFVPNIIGNAVAVALVGLLLGNPFYPIAMNITGRTVPKWYAPKVS
ncbi:hypothetical protein FRC12_013735 [Ceratobasidium sp. 428]|nr:hypothetical protein FRC12_013735 [Ceratobasidium sp. 428]